jgi:nitrate reductase assembly molybdenum cofactor insertion protein NarJ
VIAECPVEAGSLAREFSLASMLVSYPDVEAKQTVAALAPQLGVRDPLRAIVAEFAGPVEDLQSRYLELFDRGKGRVSLYETEHGRMRGLSKGNDLADLAGFYHAFGFSLDEEAAHEMLDHLAVELEFYALLLMKQDLLAAQGNNEGCEIVADARQKFLADHLGRIAPTVAAAGTVASDPVYGPVVAWCAQLIADECATLGATPAPLDFFAGGEDENSDCGSIRLPVIQ